MKRKCVGCNIITEREKLLRIVRLADDVTIETKKKLMGRGAYVCKNENCIKAAEKKSKIEKSLKTTMKPDLYCELLNYLNER